MGVLPVPKWTLREALRCVDEESFRELVCHVRLHHQAYRRRRAEIAVRSFRCFEKAQAGAQQTPRVFYLVYASKCFGRLNAWVIHLEKPLAFD